MRYGLGLIMSGTLHAAAQTPAPESDASASVVALSSVFDPDPTVYALLAIFALTFLLTFYVGVLYFRERRRIKAAQWAITNQPEPAAPLVAPTAMEWQQRALTAEALANQQALILREKLMPELTEFVKQSLVQGLAAQRDALLAMQQQALQSLLEMETRLAHLNAPLQERIRAYESRIAELEKEISQQGAEMRELTRTILELMRKKLETEQEQVAPEETFR